MTVKEKLAFAEQYIELINDSTDGDFGPGKNLFDWYAEVNKKHNSLRKVLGGIRRIEEVTLESTKVKPALCDIEYYIESLGNNYGIKSFVPNYLKEYNLTVEDLKNDYQGKVKTTRHIRVFAQRQKVSSYDMYYIDRFCSSLGGLYSSLDISSGTQKVNITTDPTAFLKLGHFGCDDGSCFGMGGGHEGDKYELGSRPTTFVCLINGNNIDECSDNGMGARAWGFTTNNHQVFHFCNLYNSGSSDNKKHIREEGFVLYIKEAVRRILKVDEVQVREDIVDLDDGSVYFNGPPTWSIMPANFKNQKCYKTIPNSNSGSKKKPQYA